MLTPVPVPLGNRGHKHSDCFASLFRLKVPAHPLSSTVVYPYLLTPWCTVLLEKQLVKKLPAFYGTRRFITTLTSLRHPSLSWASPIQSIYTHPTFWRSVLIISTHLRLGLPSGLFPSGFLTKTLYTPLSSPIRATCPAHLIRDFITRTILGEEYKSFSSSLCNLLHSPVKSSLLGPNILLSIIFSNTLSFLSSLHVSDQVSHPYKTTGKIIVLYIVIFKFLDTLVRLWLLYPKSFPFWRWSFYQPALSIFIFLCVSDRASLW